MRKKVVQLSLGALFLTACNTPKVWNEASSQLALQLEKEDRADEQARQRREQWRQEKPNLGSTKSLEELEKIGLNLVEKSLRLVVRLEESPELRLTREECSRIGHANGVFFLLRESELFNMKRFASRLNLQIENSLGRRVGHWSDIVSRLTFAWASCFSPAPAGAALGSSASAAFRPPVLLVQSGSQSEREWASRRGLKPRNTKPRTRSTEASGGILVKGGFSDEFTLGLSAITEFPLMVGAGLSFETPIGLGARASVGYLPDVYLETVTNLVESNSDGFSNEEADLIQSALRSSLFYQFAAGWRVSFKERMSLWLGMGIAKMDLGGESTGSEIFTALFPDIPVVPALLSGVEAEIATEVSLASLSVFYEYRSFESVGLFAGLGYSVILDSDSSVKIGRNIDNSLLRLGFDVLEDEAEKEIDKELENAGRFPLFLVGASYHIGLWR